MKTREAIFEAFSWLLARKDYARITVQDIIDRANVGRTTFYAHFPTREKLLEELCQDMFTHVFSARPPREETHDFSRDRRGARTTIAHLLYHLLENRRNILGILGCGGPFDGFFQKFFNEWASRALMDGAGPNPRDVPADFVINHISSSFTGMVRWWVAGGLKQTPEELAACFLAVLGPVLDRNAEPQAD